MNNATKLTKIAQMTPKDAIEPVREALNQHLQVLAKKLGLSIEVLESGIRYGSTDVQYKVQVVFPTNGKIEKPEVRYFREFATMYGLKPEDLGKSIQQKGHTFIITGLNLSRRSRPVQLTSEDGVVFDAPRVTVRASLANIDFNDPKWRFSERCQEYLDRYPSTKRKTVMDIVAQQILDELDKPWLSRVGNAGTQPATSVELT